MHSHNLSIRATIREMDTCKPHFYYEKVGVRGCKLCRHFSMIASVAMQASDG